MATVADKDEEINKSLNVRDNKRGHGTHRKRAFLRTIIMPTVADTDKEINNHLIV